MMDQFSLSPMFLWTDLMIWGLFVLLVIGIVQIRKDPQKSQQWRAVFASKTAMAAGIVLAFYFLVALADSVHFKIDTIASSSQATTESVSKFTNKSMVSLLDLSLMHLIENSERTYSAPFATKEYSSSVVYDELGQVSQQYLPLKNVINLSELGISESSYFTQKTATAFGFALIFILVLFAVQKILQTSAKLLKNKKRHGVKELSNIELTSSPLPLKTAYLTLFLIGFTFIWLYILSFDFHVLGTNKVGEDVLYQSIKSIRTGVLIGGLTTIVMLPLALILGISAGYFKGWIDDIIQYLYTTLNSIPGVLLIAAAVLVMQSIMSNNPDWFGSTEERADMRLLFLILILGMTSWTGLCRLLRAETLKISQIEYVTAAKAFGLHPFTIIRRHIYPNLVHLILIALVLDFSGLVLAEAVLSYVGVGVDPTMPSWGNMINQARLEMAREPMVWWSLLSAFCFMFVLVLAANLFADRVQWVLNPKNEK